MRPSIDNINKFIDIIMVRSDDVTSKCQYPKYSMIIHTPPPGWGRRPASAGAGHTGQNRPNQPELLLPGGQAADLQAWENLMAEALQEARQAEALGEVPVGAVVVEAGGRIICRGHNAPLSGHNPVAHAEIAAICAAAAQIQNYRLNKAVLLVTLEPCLMCAGAAVQARLAGVVYGAKDPKAGALESRLESFALDWHNHHPWQLGGILEEECAALLRDFFAKRRASQV